LNKSFGYNLSNLFHLFAAEIYNRLYLDQVYFWWGCQDLKFMNKKVLSLLLFCAVSLSLQAGSVKETLRNSTLVIVNDDEDWLAGIAKSNYAATPIKLIDYYPAEIPDGTLYYSISGYYAPVCSLKLQHEGKAYVIASFKWNRDLEKVNNIRAFHNYLGQLVEEYLAVADEKGHIHPQKLEKYRADQAKVWAKQMKGKTFYTSLATPATELKKWDKKWGKVSKTSADDLDIIIEMGTDSNGYYAVTEKKNRMLWMSGFFTMGAGFVIAPLIPKHKTTLYSTDEDRVITSFRSYNPEKKVVRIQKKIKKLQTNK